MPPICGHEQPMRGETAGEPFLLGQHCRQCWMYLNSSAARAKWDNDPNVTIISTADPEKSKEALRALGVEVKDPSPPVPITEGPGWFRKALNFSKAVVEHVWHGLPQTPTEEQERRIAICLGCPLLDQATGACTHKDCGCQVAKKTTWLMQRCPIGKW